MNFVKLTKINMHMLVIFRQNKIQEKYIIFLIFFPTFCFE